MIHFTSDLHFNHENILGFCRPMFSSVKEMNETLVRNWNSVVKWDDSVYVVGDFAMGPRAQTLEKFCPRLNGEKFLIPGNHDYCWKGGYAGEKLDTFRELYARYFTIRDHMYLGVGNDTVELNHFPFPDNLQPRHDDKYSAWSPEDRGQWLFHGHTHQTEQRTGPRSLHVGVDAWDYAPVSFDTLKAMMR